MINLDHVHFQHKTVIYFVQTFGNIYTIVPFCKHALRVFHAIAWLILLAHAQTNFPPVLHACISSYNLLHPLYLGVESHVTVRAFSRLPNDKKGKALVDNFNVSFLLYG